MRYFFARLDEKRKWENLRKFLMKIQRENWSFTIFGKIDFGNNIIFLQQFFRFRGDFPLFLLATPLTFLQKIEGAWRGQDNSQDMAQTGIAKTEAGMLNCKLITKFLNGEYMTNSVKVRKNLKILMIQWIF